MTKNVVVGIGGAGINLLDEWILAEEPRGHFYALDADFSSVEASLAERRILLGKEATKGLGSCGDLELASKIFEEEEPRIEQMLEDCEHLLVLSGLGGAMGSAGLRFFSRKASERVKTLSAIAFLPFHSEAFLRRDTARKTVQELLEFPHQFIFFSNEKAKGVFGPADDPLRVYRNLNKKVSSIISCWYHLTQAATEEAPFDSINFPSLLFVEDFYSFSLRGVEKLPDTIQPYLQPAKDAASEQNRKVAWVCFFLSPPKAEEDLRSLFQAEESLFDRFYMSIIREDMGAGEEGFVLIGNAAGEKFIEREVDKQLERIDADLADDKSSTQPADGLQKESISTGIFTKGYKTIHKGVNLDLPAFLRKGISIKI
ncbi:FtsZ/tubulin family protein [Methylacidiphilum kamchatkense]|uniref:Cell division protein FtsZ n=2 Tax=Methylacidiphilum kamchatkense Kam1 TaxID=1202785 RepID=A0A516TN22_9BACT|nr:hypothetical protein [Methylacidiphilum kamchatkense]QDQ42642.1 cell division protein FtsZ [Methylacidiphilum kamchatkense Kam1]